MQGVEHRNVNAEKVEAGWAPEGQMSLRKPRMGCILPSYLVFPNSHSARAEH